MVFVIGARLVLFLFFPFLRDDTGWKQLVFVLLYAFEVVHSYLATSHWRSTAASKEGEVSIAETYTYKKEQGVSVKNKGFSRC